jgi:AraC family transcriptional regulator, transcriptional activator of pobA
MIASSLHAIALAKEFLNVFETLLNNFFASDKPQEVGLLSVAYCANELNLSANYFGDLIKKETGKSANEYIHLKLIDAAKSKIFDGNKSVSEIAYELGFKYPQHFTRVFKQHTGVTPQEYRISTKERGFPGCRNRLFYDL